MPPPKLARNAPVADIIHPLKISGLPGAGNYLCLAFHHCGNGLLGQRFDFNEPLFGNHRFNIRLAAVALADAVGVRLGFNQIASLLQIGDNLFSCLVAVQTFIDAAVLVNIAQPVNHRNYFQIVALRNGKVVGIGSRRDLDGAGTEIGCYIFIGNDRNLPVY